jgi:DNA polymerase I
MKLPPIQVITTEKEMRAFLDRIYPHGSPAPGWESVALDTEFAIIGAPPNSVSASSTMKLVYVQLSQGTERVVIEGPVVSATHGRLVNLPLLLHDWLKDRNVKKRVSTTRADFRVLKDSGIGEMHGIEMDTEPMDWLYDENRRLHGLKDCAQDHCHIQMRDYSKIFYYHGLTKGGAKRKKPTVMSMLEVVEGKEGGHPSPWTRDEGQQKAVEYAALDPYATWQLSVFHKKALKEMGLWKWYCQVERPLTMTLIRMEDRGIRIDAGELDSIRHEVYAEVLRLEKVIRCTVDEPSLNIRSIPQLSEVLFHKLHWPVLERNDLTEAQEDDGQTEGNASLSKAVLDTYEQKGYKLATLIKAHRALSTLHNTFLVGALEKRDYVTDLLHTIFKQAKTVTGRLSSGDRILKKMNLQNIPARKEKDPYRLRKFFLPTRDGYSLVVADYSQIELYILAQVSQDKRMVQAFQRGEDLHMLTASKIFGIKLPKEPTTWVATSQEYADWKAACDEWKDRNSDKRSSAKVVNFGLNYGMSAYKLAMDFGMDVREAEKWVAAYFQLYPGVQRYMRNTIEFCEANGYVLTIAGRRRRIPEINDRDDRVRGHAQRQCVNAPIQGSAADIIKVAMNALELGARYRCSYIGPEALAEAQKAKDLGFRQLLQVHDEIVGQAPTKVVKEAAKHVQAVMEGVFPAVFSSVHIHASVGTGPNWNAAKV